MDETSGSSDNEEQSPHTLKWYPFFQYFVLGALFSCAEKSHVSHIADFFSVKASNETKNVFENAADVVHGMDTWVLVTILIGKYYFLSNHLKFVVSFFMKAQVHIIFFQYCKTNDNIIGLFFIDCDFIMFFF